ncbi:GTPase, partial [Thiovulum sp. ES]
MNYEAKKNQLLSKSENLNTAINSVIDSDKQNIIIKKTDLKEIRNLQKSSKKILDDLKEESFKIAVVGITSSGKSTLVNALTDHNVLPTAFDRCTYTTTTLVSGEGATIEFYTKDEFNKIFRELLVDIEYPNAQNEDFETFVNLDNHIENLKENNEALYTAKKDRTIKDLKDILYHRLQISTHLDKKPKEFAKTQLSDKEFKSYISEIQDELYKPISVKSAVVRSQALKDMSKSIIYDVPGFDSSIPSHRKQTLESFQNANAIVLVIDSRGGSNLDEQTLEIFKQNFQEHGTKIKLSDKLFVFGNKFDTFRNDETKNKAKSNVFTAVGGYGNSERIIFGSAFKHLNEIGVLNEKDREDANYSENEGVPANIDQLRDSLISYYKKDWFKIEEQKLKNIQSQTLEVFENILNSEELQDIDPEMDEEEMRDLIKDREKRRIKRDTVKALNDIRDSLEDKFLKEKPFAKKLTTEVKNFFKPVSVREIEDFATDKKEISLTNHTFRQHKFEELLKDFVAIVEKSVKHQTEEVERDIFGAFVKAIKDSDEVSKIIKPVFNYKNQDDKFDYLLERFGRRVLNSIIRYPIGDSDRKRAFLDHIEEFKFLDSRSDLENTTVINMIATGKAETLETESSITVFKKSFNQALQKLAISSKQFAIECENSLMPQLEELEANSESFDVDQIFRSTALSSIEEIEKEINNDIENFKTILEKAVIPTLDLEIIFMG